MPFPIVVHWNQASLQRFPRYSTSNVTQRDLDTTSKQRSRSFILVPIDFWLPI